MELGFLEYLIIGGYLYTTAVFVWFTRKWDRVVANHLEHIKTEIKALALAAAQTVIDEALTKIRLDKLEKK